MTTTTRPGSKPARRVYAYTTIYSAFTPWLGSRAGAGWIKVADTVEKDVRCHIAGQLHDYSGNYDSFEVLADEPGMTYAGKPFGAARVQKALRDAGINEPAKGWFEASAEDVYSAIDSLMGLAPIRRTATFEPRPEQKRAVAMTADFFRRNTKDIHQAAPHFLWNAKMRFGKTFTTYQLAKEMGWKNIIVLTYKPAVKSAWREDLLGHVDFEGWQFKDIDTDLSDIDPGKPLVWFATFQDMLGKDADGAPKSNNLAAHDITWDCVVLDESHFGSWRERAKSLIEDQGQEAGEVSFEDVVADAHSLTVNNYLYLSGTPFRALSEGQFTEDSIFSWTYADEQKAKRTWLSEDGENPYLALPEVELHTYSLDDVTGAAGGPEYGDDGEGGFDLGRFFKASPVPDSNPVAHDFEDPWPVRQWLDFIQGKNLPEAYEPPAGAASPFPFGDPAMVEQLLHTIWYLPDVASCRAMAAMLRSDPFFKDYTTVVAAGSDAQMGAKALIPVENAITKKPENTRTITLSCSKLMTGVTVAPWTGIFMLRGSRSPEAYFQAAFRVQSPWTRKAAGGAKAEIIKRKCFIFDFDPDRALSLIAEYNHHLGDYAGATIEERVDEFVSYMPIKHFSEGSFRKLTAAGVLDGAIAGTTATMLAKRWQSKDLINITDAAVARLMSDPDLVRALEQGTWLGGGIQPAERMSSASVSATGTGSAPGARASAIDPARTTQKAWRRQLSAKLSGIVASLPVFMYLTDNREGAITDILQTEDPQLFESVTGLAATNFEKLHKIGLFNQGNLRSVIWNFKKFEELSLNYAGGRDPSDEDGGKPVAGRAARVAGVEVPA